MKNLNYTLLAAVITATITATTAYSQPVITIDEFGNGNISGTPLPSALALDPFSGMTTLSYTLPFPAIGGILSSPMFLARYPTSCASMEISPCTSTQTTTCPNRILLRLTWAFRQPSSRRQCSPKRPVWNPVLTGCSVTTPDLPCPAAPQPIPKGARSVTLTIESKPNSPTGRFPIVISGRSTFAGRGIRNFAEVVYLDVRPAVTLTLAAPEVTIKVGGSVKVAVKADRLPAYKGPVPVTFVNLPAGVTSPGATIAEGQTEALIDLIVAADAPLTAVDNVVARTAFDINGQKESTDSAPMRLKIVAAQ